MEQILDEWLRIPLFDDWNSSGTMICHCNEGMPSQPVDKRSVGKGANLHWIAWIIVRALLTFALRVIAAHVDVVLKRVLV